MRIDYEYLQKILDVFLESELPTVTWNSFPKELVEDEHKMVFHLEILFDKGVIQSLHEYGKSGIHRSTHSDEYTISISDWRLTADGHDFASALSKPDVISEISSKFREQSGVNSPGSDLKLSITS